MINYKSSSPDNDHTQTARTERINVAPTPCPRPLHQPSRAGTRRASRTLVPLAQRHSPPKRHSPPALSCTRPKLHSPQRFCARGMRQHSKGLEQRRTHPFDTVHRLNRLQQGGTPTTSREPAFDHARVEGVHDHVGARAVTVCLRCLRRLPRKSIDRGQWTSPREPAAARVQARREGACRSRSCGATRPSFVQRRAG